MAAVQLPSKTCLLYLAVQWIRKKTSRDVINYTVTATWNICPHSYHWAIIHWKVISTHSENLSLLFSHYHSVTNEKPFLGMDRLCASTESGRLQFYVIGPSSHHSGDADSLDLDGISCKTQSVRDDSLDNVDSANQIGLCSRLLYYLNFKKESTAECLKGTHLGVRINIHNLNLSFLLLF